VLSDEETKSLAGAQKGTPEEFRNALIKVASMKDQANDQGEQLRNQTASLDNIKINTGDKLLNPIIAMSDAIVAASGRTPQSAREAVINQSYDDSEAQINEEAHRRTIAAAKLPYSKQLDELDKIRKEQYQAIQIDEAHRAADLRNAHSPYEITVNANVNVKTPDGGVQKTATRTNVGAPQPSGSRTVNVGTH
jgi:hypothetical protein